MPIKMIVVDLDKTLLSTDKAISGYTADVLNQCKEKGLKIVFATARPERATKRFQEKIVPDFVVADNGATVYAGEAVLLRLLIPQATTDALIPVLLNAREVSLITVEAGNCVYTNYRGQPWEEGWNIIHTDFGDGFSADTPKISAECADRDFLSKLLNHFPDLHLYSNSGEAWHQIMHKSGTKLNAIRYIAQKCGLSLDDIAAFGDDYNDIEMLQHCGIGVAMANAIDEAKAVADDVCESNDNDGVARWLEQNLLKSITDEVELREKP